MITTALARQSYRLALEPSTYNIQGNLKTLSQKCFQAARKALSEDLTKTSNALTNNSSYKVELFSSHPDAPRHLYSLNKKYSKIEKMLNQREEDIDPEKMQSIRRKIHKALQSDAYAFFSKSPTNVKEEIIDSPQLFVKFLHHISYQINTQTEAMGVVEKIGADVLGKYSTFSKKTQTEDQKITAGQLSQWTKEVFSTIPADSIDGVLNCIMWALKNIARAFCAFLDGHISGYHYNSYEFGNANMWIGDLVIKGKTVRKNRGPSVPCDLLFEAQLKWERSQGIKHLQHTLECTAHCGERSRLEKMRDLAESESETLTLLGTPLDGDIWRGKGNFENFRSAQEFHTQLKEKLLNLRSEIPEEIKDYNGFAIPLLEKGDIDATIKASEKAFSALGNIDTSDPKTNARYSKAMLLGFTGFLTLKMLCKFEESKLRRDNTQEISDQVAKTIEATMGQQCKQGVDRGPIVNAMVMAYIQMINNDGLRDKDAKQIVGLLLTCALMVDERLMVKSRLEAFLELFELIGKNEEAFVKELQAFIPKGKIQFKPSNDVMTEELRAR